MKPVVIDLCCGLGGWSKGFIAEGWDAIGFDIERHEYGDKRYPGELILRSILEINGYDLRAVNPALVVASPPCQEFSYMAMPWKRGKQIAGALREQCPFPEGYDGSRTVAELTALYDACFRIARQIGCPIVLENVKGAQPWVGRAKAHFGSYYLWGDVADVGGRVVRADRRPQFGSGVRPSGGRKYNPDGTAHGQGSWFAIADSKDRGAQKREGRNFHAFENGLGSSPSFNGGEHETRGVAVKVEGISFSGYGEPGYKAQGFNVTAAQRYRGVKCPGNDTFRETGAPCGKLTDARYPSDGVKIGGSGDEYWRKPLEAKRREATAVKNGGDWFASGDDCSLQRRASSKSDSRKAASAMIAEIPFPLAQYIARAFKPNAVHQHEVADSIHA